MVQLKSFRYIEIDDENQAATPNTPTPQQSRSSSTSSESNISSLISGGNLTMTGVDESSIHSNNQTSNSTTIREEESTTLASNEEYQVANHDIIEEEDEEEEQKIENLENQQAALDGVRVDEMDENNVTMSKSGLTKGLPESIKNSAFQPLKQPLSPSINNKYFRTQSVGSPKVLKHSSSLHSLGKQHPADSISQYSFTQKSPQQSNNFEIRWHNINLRTTANSGILPKFLTDSMLYKAFAGKPKPVEAQPERVIHSPPLNSHRFAPAKRSIPNEGSIISEKEISMAMNGGNLNEGRTILNNVSGSVLSGQLTAILGPSGVGKTTLLNSLTGRNTLEGNGQVLLFGAGANVKRMSVVTVPQTDILPAKLTTLEDLQFTSRLKNPQRGFNHKRNIDRIVKHLHMDKFLHTKIEKLSGGEARRLSIARELLSSPDIMILDEPTSGLDANTCKKIITALRDIVVHSDNILDRPMAIIVTIHQPQQEVFNLFHRIYVMAQGGRSIYEGPPTSLLSYFLEHTSITRICPVDQLNENPAIVAIEVASGEYGPNIIEELAMVHESQMYEDYASSLAGTPITTPKTGGKQHMSPLSLGTPRFNHLRHHHPRLKSPRTSESLSMGKPTPILPIKRLIQQQQQFDNLSNLTSLSYASTYDAELPESTTQLKVDKRLRRSVVMKDDFLSHTYTLMQRCWLLTTRDLFLMCIRVLGYLLIAAGTVQIFSHVLDINENQCPFYETEVGDIRDFMVNIKNRLMNLSTQMNQASATHLFFFHLNLCITIVTSALTGLVFPMQIRMFIREYKNGWYSPSSFISSLTIAELPIDMIGPTITILIIYPLCNQPMSAYYWRELAYILVTALTSIIAKSQAQIVGAFLMDSVENSVFMSCVLVTPAALLSGVAVRIASMNWLLQILSYGSYLRYNIECFFVIRYGYDMCPCNPELVYGYPTKTSADAIPPQLNRMVQGFLELHSTASVESTSNTTYNLTTIGSNQNQSLALINEPDSDDGNLILKFIRLISNSGNLFVAKLEDLGDCSKYRSLYLIDMGIDDRILLKWISVMIMIYIISRYLTYLAVKTVIKLRKGS